MLVQLVKAVGQFLLPKPLLYILRFPMDGRLGIIFASNMESKITPRGQHSTMVRKPQPPAPGLIPSIVKKISKEKIVDAAEVYQWQSRGKRNVA